MPESVKKAVECLQAGKFAQSIEMFQKLLSQSSHNKTQSKHKEILLHLCAAHLELGHFGICQEICNRMLAEDPEMEDAYFYMTISLASLQKFDQSLNICNQRLKFNTKNWKLYFAKAYVLEKMAKYQQASVNYSIAITKNILNNPRSYLLQTGCLVALDQGQAAHKNMHYALMAIKEDQHKNCQGHYKYEITNIKIGLQCYEAYLKKLNKAQAEFHITKSELQNYEKQLIKIVSKAGQYGSTAFKHHTHKHNHSLFGELDNYSQEKGLEIDLESEPSDFWNELQIFQGSLKLKIRQSFKLKTKDSIESEILTKNETQSKIACEWIRQKCSIF